MPLRRPPPPKKKPKGTPIPKAAPVPDVVAREKRSPFYDREIRERVLKLLRGGTTRETAMAAVGLSDSVLQLWLRKGREAEEEDRQGDLHLEFMVQVQQAEAAAVLICEQSVLTAAAGHLLRDKKGRTIPDPDDLTGKAKLRAPGNWGAASWYLSKRARHAYGSSEPVRLDPDKDGPVRDDLDDVMAALGLVERKVEG